MKQQNLEALIEKEQQKNIYLSGVLNSLEIKINMRPIQPETESEVRGEVQMAQIKSINKHIQVYQQQLQKIKNINSKSLVNELKQMKDEITNKQDELSKLTKQLQSLEQETSQIRTKSYGKDKNKSIQTVFGHKAYEMEALKIKLQHLQTIEGIKTYQSPRKNNRSYSQTIKQPQIPLEGDRQQSAHKHALFRNLIRFYTVEQQKLKKQMISLEQTRLLKQKENQLVTIQIGSYQAKIAALKKQPNYIDIK